MSIPHRSAVAGGKSGRRRKLLGWFFLCVAVPLTMTKSAQPGLGANGTWNINATTSAWQTALNWTGGVPGATTGTANPDTATFNNASSKTGVDPDPGRNLEFITFSGSAAAYRIGSIGGNALLLSSNGQIQITNTVGTIGAETIDAPLTLEGNYTFTNSSNNLLIFDSPISGGGAGTGTLSIGGSGPVYINGAVGGGSGSIAVMIPAFATGIVNLNGNNTFTGGLTVNSATLFLNGNNTIGGGVLINGGALVLGSAGALNSSVPNAVVFGPNSGGSLNLNGNSVTVAGLSTSGPVGLAVVQNASSSPATLTVNNAASNTYAGVLADGSGGAPLSLVKFGGGALTLTNVNTFSGGLTLNAGTLIVGNNNALGTAILTAGGGTLQADSNGPYFIGNAINLNSTLIVAGTSGLTLNGAVSGSGGLTMNGMGILTFSGVNTFSGPVIVNTGTVIQNTTLACNVTNQSNFISNGGGISGRLTNLGVATFNASFTAGSGLENDAAVQISSGAAITLNGAGLNNQGNLFFTSGGSLAVSQTNSNVNGGSLTLSPTALLILGGSGMLNNNGGTLNLNGGTVVGATGQLINNFGGVVTGPGTIASTFNNSGGELLVGNGVIKISQAFANTGTIQLTGASSNLTGGAITNMATIIGQGSVANAVTNSGGGGVSGNGAIEATGGILNIGGTLTNPGGLIVANAGAELLVSQGLATNSGIINLIGGTFDNNGLSLNNTGQISGWGVFRTGNTGLDNHGSITFSGGLTTVNGPVTNEGGKTITVAQNPAIFTGMVTNNLNATFNTTNATATFAGGFTNNGNSNFAAVGNGAIEVPVAPAFGNASSLAIGGASDMRFNAISGAATIGAGVTATVTSSATLELAGSVSALSSGANRANVTNYSTAAAGILVSGTNQVVGNIDGSGTTQVNAGSDLTANHIIQAALVIGGTAGSHGLVTIDASDASGNPLVQSSGFALAGSLVRSGPFGEGVTSSGNLSSIAADSTDLGVPAAGNSVGIGNASQVPEPSTLMLALLAVLGAVSTQFVRRYFRCQTV